MLQAQQAGRLKWIRLWNIVQGKQRGVRPLQEIFGKWTRQIKVCLPANCILLHWGPASSLLTVRHCLANRGACVPVVMRTQSCTQQLSSDLAHLSHLSSWQGHP